MTTAVALPPGWQHGAFDSAAAERTIPYAVHLPAGITAGRRYPVLYVLQGLGGDEAHWPRGCPALLPALATAGLEVLVVSPGVGPTCFLRSVRGDFELATARDLVQHIDTTYQTIDDPTARALMGFSMGGFGSLYLTLRHPDVFGAAAAFGSAVHLGQRADSQHPLSADLVEPNPARRLEHDIFHQVVAAPRQRLEALRWWLTVGTEDHLVAINRAFHHYLLAHRVPHDYVEGPGAHTWEFVESQLPAALASLPPPTCPKALALSTTTSPRSSGHMSSAVSTRPPAA